MSAELRVAVAQMTSVDDVDANFEQIKNLIEKVPRDEMVDLFCFPENCLYMRLKEGKKIEGFELTHDVFKKLGQIAQDRKAYLHLGASPLLQGGVLYSSSILMDPQGTATSTYSKIHLFDIQLKNDKPLRESDVFNHGSEARIIEINGWKIGQSICYDLRFAELFSFYAKEECDLILIPSSFLPKTGEAHWDTLVRARAIESQAYVVASGQGGTHVSVHGDGKRTTHGNSLIVDPWGQVLVRLTQQPEISVQCLYKSKINEVREQIPMRSHRRFRPS